MAVLNFSLTPEVTTQIYEALVCLAKFGESVAIEARGDKVRLFGASIKAKAAVTDTNQNTTSSLSLL